MTTILRDSVRDVWWALNEPWEGAIPHFYRDTKNLVTVGLGQLVDPGPLAVAMPMLRADGTRATTQEIWDEWRVIKTAPGLDVKGWKAAAKLCKLHLSKSEMERLALLKLDANATRLAKRWSKFSTWPADAQAALSSWAWACGPAAAYPKMSAALAVGNFFAASFQINADENAPAGSTIHKRNTANRCMLRNASRVVELTLNPETLFWPVEIGPEPQGAA